MMNFISGVNMFFLFKMHLDGSWRDFRSRAGLMLEEMTANHHVEKVYEGCKLLTNLSTYTDNPMSDEDLRLLPAFDWPINRKVKQAFELSAFLHQAPYKLYFISHTASNLPPNARRTALPFSISNRLLNGLCPSWYQLWWGES